jgi:hypothetical protein
LFFPDDGFTTVSGETDDKKSEYKHNQLNDEEKTDTNTAIFGLAIQSGHINGGPTFKAYFRLKSRFAQAKSCINIPEVTISVLKTELHEGEEFSSSLARASCH